MADELALGRAIREAVNGRNVMEFDERASRAVHSFLGVEKGKELKRNMWPIVMHRLSFAYEIAQDPEVKHNIAEAMRHLGGSANESYPNPCIRCEEVEGD